MGIGAWAAGIWGLAAMLAPVAGTHAAEAVGTYVVQSGDTLSHIAERVGTHSSEIARLNGIIDPGRLRPGTVLTVPLGEQAQPPSPEAVGRLHLLAPGETLGGVAERYGVSARAIASANGVDDPRRLRAGETLRIPEADPAPAPPVEPTASAAAPVAPVQTGEAVEHTLASGETLLAVSRRYGVPARAIMAANGIDDPHRLRAGRVLRVPAPAAAVEVSAPAVATGEGVDVAPAAAAVDRTADADAVAAREPAAADAIEHALAPGETLLELAGRYGVSARDIMVANDVDDPRRLRAGRVLRIPGAIAQPATRPAEAPAAEVAASAVPTEPSPDAPAIEHELARGETLLGLAQRYGVPARSIAQTNAIDDPRRLRAGQTLRIPTVAAASTESSESRPSETPPPRPAPSAAPVASSTDTPRSEEPAAREHRLESGETLLALAKRYGVPARTIAEANDIADPRRLRAGAMLRIPGDAKPAEPPAVEVVAPEAPKPAVVAQSEAPSAPTPQGREHVLAPGETLLGLAGRYGVAAGAIAEANGIDDPRRLRAGQTLRIPGTPRSEVVSAPTVSAAVSGAEAVKVAARVEPTAISEPASQTPVQRVHVVRRGDTVLGIAQRYGVSPSTLSRANRISDPRRLRAGQRLVIPGRVPPAIAAARLGGGTFVWPLANYRVTSEFGSRRGRHLGIDLWAPRGTAIHAAADGVVQFSGWRRGYGRVVVLQHPTGVRTLYAHNTANLVRHGQRVRQGEVVATVGRSGKASGNHVHFEVIIDGRQVNPREYVGRSLPKGLLLASTTPASGDSTAAASGQGMSESGTGDAEATPRRAPVVVASSARRPSIEGRIGAGDSSSGLARVSFKTKSPPASTAAVSPPAPAKDASGLASFLGFDWIGGDADPELAVESARSRLEGR
ncbi:MAG: LysM peptidoglycan-binding domain-containing protein [Ectothiorhodospiraceae bacterium]|nr:LysM peptidoglycan-binding domain-containing protein [Ectothiorhodospiraceae bacterium]